MMVRTSLMMAALAMLATPIWAQEGAPSGRQELAEQQQEGDAQRAPAQGRAQQGEVRPQGQVRQQGQIREGQQGQGRVAQPTGEVDHRQLAHMFILSNQAEVELGQLAAEKSENKKVREFAEMMVKDHSACIAKLKKFTGDDAAQTGSRKPTVVRDGADEPRSSTTVQAKSEHDGMLGFAKKSSQLELAMTKQMLSKYEGQDFDMGYLGQQMIAHTKMLACLTAAQDIGPEDFQKAIGEGITTTRTHMQHAQQLAAQIKNKEYGEGQERRESARPDLREGDEPRDEDIRDGGARPSVRPRNSDAPREGAPQRGTPQPRNRTGAEDATDGAADSARDLEDATP